MEFILVTDFLAENADFAELCEECDIKFIGPTSDAIKSMGIKDVAKVNDAKSWCSNGSRFERNC